MSAFQHFPQIIAYCGGASDVVACLRFARETGLRVVCRAGGHSTAGYSVNDEMVIDVSVMSYVHIDQTRHLATVGAGTNFGRLNAEIDLFGLHVPGGGCETVCVAGYMQGGGYGFTSLLFGMNCDQVTGVRMALASGQVVEATAASTRISSGRCAAARATTLACCWRSPTSCRSLTIPSRVYRHP